MSVLDEEWAVSPGDERRVNGPGGVEVLRAPQWTEHAPLRARLAAHAPEMARMLQRLVKDAKCDASCTPESCTSFEVRALLEKAGAGG